MKRRFRRHQDSGDRQDPRDHSTDRAANPHDRIGHQDSKWPFHRLIKRIAHRFMVGRNR